MYWPTPSFSLNPTDKKKYHLFRCILIIILIAIGGIASLSILKQYSITKEIFEDVQFVLLCFVVAAVLFVFIHIVSIFEHNSSVHAENEKNNDLLRKWQTWAQRKTPVLGFSTYNSIGEDIIQTESALSSEESKQIAIQTFSALLYDFYPLLSRTLAHKKIDVVLITNSDSFTPDVVKQIWSDAKLDQQQLDTIVITQQNMSDFFVEWYKSSVEQYKLVIVLEKTSDGNTFANGWVLQNALKLLNQSIPVIAHLNRMLHTENNKVSENLPKLSLLQPLEYAMKHLVFFDLSSDEKSKYIEQLYLSKYLPQNQVPEHLALEEMITSKMLFSDWNSFAYVMQKMLVNEDDKCISHIVVKKNDVLSLGAILKIANHR